MLSIIIFVVLFIVAMFLLIRAILNYRMQKEFNEFMALQMKQQEAQKEYEHIYNECKRKQEELLNSKEQED